jgi:hypothetical protein
MIQNDPKYAVQGDEIVLNMCSADPDGFIVDERSSRLMIEVIFSLPNRWLDTM